jgi:hypothetical protein
VKESVLQAVFAGAAVLVVASFAAVLLRHVPSRILEFAAGVCAVGAAAGWAFFGLDPSQTLAVAATGLTLCAAAEVGAVALARTRARRVQVELDLTEAEDRFSKLISEEAERRAAELARTLARAPPGVL